MRRTKCTSAETMDTRIQEKRRRGEEMTVMTCVSANDDEN